MFRGVDQVRQRAAYMSSLPVDCCESTGLSPVDGSDFAEAPFLRDMAKERYDTKVVTEVVDRFQTVDTS
jgi:hypothetical protein